MSARVGPAEHDNMVIAMSEHGRFSQYFRTFQSITIPMLLEHALLMVQHPQLGIFRCQDTAYTQARQEKRHLRTLTRNPVIFGYFHDIWWACCSFPRFDIIDSTLQLFPLSAPKKTEQQSDIASSSYIPNAHRVTNYRDPLYNVILYGEYGYSTHEVHKPSGSM